MLTDLFGLGATDHISSALMWRWAADHPFYFTVIKTSHSLMAAIVVGGVIGIVRSMWRRN